MDHKYRKKPVVVEAYQMTKERRRNNSEWPTWLNEAWQKAPWEINSVSSEGFVCVRISGDKLVIKTLEGYIKVHWNDYIIQSVEGELYPCKQGIFEKTYEKVIWAYLD